MLMPQGLWIGSAGWDTRPTAACCTSLAIERTLLWTCRLAKLSVNSSRSAFSSEILAGQV